MPNADIRRSPAHRRRSAAECHPSSTTQRKRTQRPRSVRRCGGGSGGAKGARGSGAAGGLRPCLHGGAKAGLKALKQGPQSAETAKDPKNKSPRAGNGQGPEKEGTAVSGSHARGIPWPFSALLPTTSSDSRALALSPAGPLQRRGRGLPRRWPCGGPTNPAGPTQTRA